MSWDRRNIEMRCVQGSEIVKLITLTVLVLFVGKYYYLKGSPVNNDGSAQRSGIPSSPTVGVDRCADVVNTKSKHDMFRVAASTGRNDVRAVLIVARHGDRTPSRVIPQQTQFWSSLLPDASLLDMSYPIAERIAAREASKWPFGGRLTAQGLCEMLALASTLTETYKQVVSDNASKPTFYSTDYERTARSAAVVSSVISPIRQSGAFPVISVPREEDPLDPWESVADFPRKVGEFETSNRTFLRLAHEAEEVRRRLLHALDGRYLTDLTFDWISAFDLFVTADAHPSFDSSLDAVVSSFKEEVYRITLNQFACLYEDRAIRTLAVGGLLSGMASWFSGKANESAFQATPAARQQMHFQPDSNFIFVSCHDVNLLPLKIALGWEADEDITWPEYGYFMSFELLQKKNTSKATVRGIDSRGKMREFTMDEFIRLCS